VADNEEHSIGSAREQKPSGTKRPVRTVFSWQSKPVILEEWEVREPRKF